METRTIGGLEVSEVGLGCNNLGRRLDSAGSDAVVGAALDAGVTLFDTADFYGETKSEEFLGRALGKRRDQAVLATKFGAPLDETGGGASPAYVRRAVEASLTRLGTDRIDLYQLHLPDPETPVSETLGALDELARQGKIREIGCSNFTADQLREAEGAAVAGGLTRFVTVQNEYNLFHREPEADVLPECDRLDIRFLPYRPLASGVLTGKYRLGRPAPEGTRLSGDARPNPDYADRLLADDSLARVEALIDLAESNDHTILDLAFAWLLSRPQVPSVIAGASTPEQVRANVAAGEWMLSEELLGRIDEIVSA